MFPPPGYGALIARDDKHSCQFSQIIASFSCDTDVFGFFTTDSKMAYFPSSSLKTSLIKIYESNPVGQKSECFSKIYGLCSNGKLYSRLKIYLYKISTFDPLLAETKNNDAA